MRRPFLSVNMLHQLVGIQWGIGNKPGCSQPSAYSDNVAIVEKELILPLLVVCNNLLIGTTMCVCACVCRLRVSLLTLLSVKTIRTTDIVNPWNVWYVEYTTSFLWCSCQTRNLSPIMRKKPDKPKLRDIWQKSLIDIFLKCREHERQGKTEKQLLIGGD